MSRGYQIRYENQERSRAVDTHFFAYNYFVREFLSQTETKRMKCRIGMKSKLMSDVLSYTFAREVVERAKEIGLDISQFCDNCLKEAIEALEQRKAKTVSNGGLVDARSVFASEDWWGRPDSNRGPESPSLRAWTMLADGPPQKLSRLGNSKQ
jgi:post-segregation antitoxin (ccd killing protein)